MRLPYESYATESKFGPYCFSMTQTHLREFDFALTLQLALELELAIHPGLAPEAESSFAACEDEDWSIADAIEDEHGSEGCLEPEA